MMWLTTFDEITADPLGPIWVRPLDYLNVTRDTPFDPQKQPVDPNYRRRIEREAWVEGRVQKHAILTRDGDRPMTPIKVASQG